MSNILIQICVCTLMLNNYYLIVLDGVSDFCVFWIIDHVVLYIFCPVPPDSVSKKKRVLLMISAQLSRDKWLFVIIVIIIQLLLIFRQNTQRKKNKTKLLSFPFPPIMIFHLLVST